MHETVVEFSGDACCGLAGPCQRFHPWQKLMWPKGLSGKSWLLAFSRTATAVSHYGVLCSEGQAS